MTAEHAEWGDEPLIPMPPLKIRALREAVAVLSPTCLPESQQEEDEALDWVAENLQPNAIRLFLRKWAVFVAIERRPVLAGRLRELERVVARLHDPQEVRDVGTEIARLRAEAHREIAARSLTSAP
ncbi:hypothetical protein [Embleya scabrispora]|uniref:hypothetical protein n=1 Tax=Embleya scabrispora TaxID=159449 RepID=UPI000594006B|nr:hypothetical protein [Embleya scabrispora]MYS81079.1 hypothetical protein [Streptomyces sp. SID5474]